MMNIIWIIIILYSIENNSDRNMQIDNLTTRDCYQQFGDFLIQYIQRLFINLKAGQILCRCNKNFGCTRKCAACICYIMSVRNPTGNRQSAIGSGPPGSFTHHCCLWWLTTLLRGLHYITNILHLY